MKFLACVIGCATFALTACTEFQGTQPSVDGQPVDYRTSNVPDGLRAIAAPYQDLSEVRINDSDGCYVYRYAGPVETTFLPLRTNDGTQICTRSPEI